MSSVRIDTYDRLKNLIISGELSPGEKLSETELAKKLSASRTPIREAFRQLQSEGHINIIHNKGAYVAKLPPKNIEEIYSIIALLEGYASEIMTEKVTSVDIKELRKMAQRMTLYASHKKYQEYTILNSEFHRFMTHFSGNSILIKIYEELRMQVYRYRMMSITIPGHWETYLLDHERIIDALSKKDALLVGRLTREHVSRVKKILVDFLKNNPGF